MILISLYPYKANANYLQCVLKTTKCIYDYFGCSVFVWLQNHVAYVVIIFENVWMDRPKIHDA